MAVTAFIHRLKKTSGGLTDADLGMDMGMGTQVPITDSLSTHPGSKLLTDHALATSYLKSIYAPLKRHYDWFRRTQRGQIKQYGRKARSRTEAYRWRGRSEQHVLTSGMDDYPRGPPHAGELHLDLISWMAFFSRTMRVGATVRSRRPLVGSAVNMIPDAVAGAMACTTTASRTSSCGTPARARYCMARAVHKDAQQRATAARTAPWPQTLRKVSC